MTEKDEELESLFLRFDQELQRSELEQTSTFQRAYRAGWNDALDEMKARIAQKMLTKQEK